MTFVDRLDTVGGNWFRGIAVVVLFVLMFASAIYRSELDDYNYPKPDGIPHDGQTILTAESPSCPSCGYPDCGCPNLTLQPTPVVQPLVTPVPDMLGALPTGVTFPPTSNDIVIVPDPVRPIPPPPVPLVPPAFNPPPAIKPTLKPVGPVPVYTLVP